MGVTLVDSPKDLLGKVDGMLIESLEGEMHLEKARPFLQAGIPCFIDKPFSGSVDTAKTILELSAKHNAPVFSSSSHRSARTGCHHDRCPRHDRGETWFRVGG